MHAELVAQARGGDREAFAVLAGGAVDRLYRIARLILRDADLAEDATQEALASASRHLPTLRDVERFDAWLYRLTVNACAEAGRHRRRWQAEVTILRTEPSEPDHASDLVDQVVVTWMTGCGGAVAYQWTPVENGIQLSTPDYPWIYGALYDRTWTRIPSASPTP